MRRDHIKWSNIVKQLIDKDVLVLPGQLFCPNVSINRNIMDISEYQVTFDK